MNDLIQDVQRFLRESQPTFRPGDRVRVSEHTASAYARNATGTIVQHANLHYWQVQLDHLQGQGASILSQSELIKID